MQRCLIPPFRSLFQALLLVFFCAFRSAWAAPDPALVEAAEGGNPQAMVRLGVAGLDQPDGPDRDVAIRWLRRAALSEDPEARSEAWMYLGRLQDDLLLRTQVDYDLTLDPAIPSAGAALFATEETEAALQVLFREAWLLNAAAERYLAILYEEEFEGFPRHDPRIRKFFEAADQDGIPSARVFLGRVHLYGIGVPADPDKGRQLLESARHPQGQMELAQYALLLRDEEQAARHWLVAAEEYTFAPALFNLGIRAQREGSDRTAQEYFERALARDPEHHGARLELGRLLGKGGHSAIDPQRSLELIRSVADQAQGRIRLIALANLGLVYMDGVHVEPDFEQALSLFREAEAGGLESVRPYIRKLEQQRSPTPTP